MAVIDRAIHHGLDWLLPRRCVLCSRLGTGLCGPCAERLAPPIGGRPPPGIDRVVALCAYEGAGRSLVLGLKRGGRRDAVGDLGAALAEGLQCALTAGGAVGGAVGGPAGGPLSLVRDLTPTITWAPTTDRRRRSRGFDQAELLARAVARSGGWSCARLLSRHSPPQAGLDLAHRRHGPRFEPRGAAPPLVVLVDDVVTSGATMSAAADALHHGGARHVVAAVIARAERHG